MNWENTGAYNLWAGPISNRAAKEEVAKRIAENVKDGQTIGVGSGSTAYVAIQAIAERVRRERLHVKAICTSPEVEMACAAVDLPIASLLQQRPDWCFDGADEVDPEHNLIKGRGGAMYLEKILIDASPKCFILVDKTKLVARLGEKFAIPVEITPLALHVVERGLSRIGATEIQLRLAMKKDGPVITQTGNFIFDVRFPEVHAELEHDIKAITGVIESGLFLGRKPEIVLAG